jgi:hypothetical protein
MKCMNTRVQCINQNNRSNTIKMKSHTCMVIQTVNRSRAWGFEVLAAVLGWRDSGMPTSCSWKKITDVPKEPPARSWKFPERVYRSTKLRFAASQKTVIRTIFGSFFIMSTTHCIFMRQLIWRWRGISQVNMSSNWFQECIYLCIQVLVNAGWSKSLCAPDDYSTIIRCTHFLIILYKHRIWRPIGVLRRLRNCSLKTLSLFAD